MLLTPTRAERAQIRMMDQLTQHLGDMAELRRQVEAAREVCGPRSDGRLLLDELAATLDDHHDMIAEQVRGLQGNPVA